MLNLMPLVAFILIGVIWFSRVSKNWRDSILSALVIWGVILTAITEFFSGLRIINFPGLIVVWLAIDIALMTAYFRLYSKRANFIRTIKLQINHLFKLPRFSLLLIGGVTLLVTLVGLVAVVAAPNHSDSMEYHMSRVIHWIQNSSIAHYPTHTVFQLYQNPWSEFAIMHFQILSGSDRFANLIQWGSMVGSLVGVSLIAKQLGAKLRGQILATVVCATIPMGILQASSTNNDYVVALWLVCFAYFTLLIVQEGATLGNTCLLGASLGLAILTKGTAYVYALPFCFLLALWGIKNLRQRIWQPILVVSILVLAINLGHYTRNLDVFSSPLGSSTGETNKAFSGATLIANVTKNLALHADIVRNLGLEGIITPTTGITEKAITILHGFLGLDINDPRIMSPKASRFYVPGLSTYEDTAGNPLHLLLILLAFVLLIANKRLRKNLHLIIYGVTVLTGFLLFCFLFTWSAKRCRLHLPLFILFSPFVGVAFSKSLNYRITSILAVFLLLLSHPWVFNNSVRPLIGNKSILTTSRIEQYFITQQFLQKPYTDAVEVVKAQNCSNLGLVLEQTAFEYPLWVQLQQDNKNARLRHTNVTNESAIKTNQLPYRDLKPCAIISINRTIDEPKPAIATSHGTYQNYWSQDFGKQPGLIQVLTPQ